MRIASINQLTGVNMPNQKGVDNQNSNVNFGTGFGKDLKKYLAANWREFDTCTAEITALQKDGRTDRVLDTCKSAITLLSDRIKRLSANPHCKADSVLEESIAQGSPRIVLDTANLRTLFRKGAQNLDAHENNIMLRKERSIAATEKDLAKKATDEVKRKAFLELIDFREPKPKAKAKQSNRSK
jgi:hypothetical protein